MSTTLYLQLPGYVSRSEELLLAFLQLKAYKKSYAYLGVKFLAKRLKASERSVERWLKNLKDYGFITVQRKCRTNAHISLNYDVLMQYDLNYDSLQEQDFHNIPDEKLINNETKLSTISVDNVLSNDENMDVQNVFDPPSGSDVIYKYKSIELYNNISNTLNINDTGDNNMTDLNNKTFEQITETPVQNHTLTVKIATENKKMFDEIREKLKTQARTNKLRPCKDDNSHLYNETAPSQYIPTEEKIKPYQEPIIDEYIPIPKAIKEEIQMRKQNETLKPCYDYGNKVERNMYGEIEEESDDIDFDDLLLDYDED